MLAEPTEEDISDLNSFAAAGITPQNPPKAAVDIDRIPVYQDELDAYITSTFDISDELDSIIEVTDENNPKLHNYDDREDLEGMRQYT